MTSGRSRKPKDGLRIEALLALPTIAAEEFASWSMTHLQSEQPPEQRQDSPFASEREYRFCKAVVDHPLKASSTYPKLAGMSSKTAQAVRRSLIEKGYIRGHALDTKGRGRSALVLEVLAAGKAAVSQHESGEE